MEWNENRIWSKCTNCEAIEYVRYDEEAEPWVCPYCEWTNNVPKSPLSEILYGDSTWVCHNCHLKCSDALYYYRGVACERWLRNSGDDTSPITIEQAELNDPSEL